MSESFHLPHFDWLTPWLYLCYFFITFLRWNESIAFSLVAVNVHKSELYKKCLLYNNYIRKFLWRLKVFACKRYILVKCPYLCLTGYLSFTWSFRVSNSERTGFLIWSILFLSLVMVEISSAYSWYTAIVFWYGWEFGWSGDRKFLAYLIIVKVNSLALKPSPCRTPVSVLKNCFLQFHIVLLVQY